VCRAIFKSEDLTGAVGLIVNCTGAATGTCFLRKRVDSVGLCNEKYFDSTNTLLDVSDFHSHRSLMKKQSMHASFIFFPKILASAKGSSS
jgi:hypothetical protein